MSEKNVSTYYMGSFIGSLIGGLMILLFDFAGWDDSNYYLGVYSEGWIWIDSIAGLVTLVPVGIGLLYVAYNSYLGTKEPLLDDKLDMIYKISLVAFIATLVGAVIFILSIVGEDVYWWLDAGFYGAAIGGLISTLSLRTLKNS